MSHDNMNEDQLAALAGVGFDLSPRAPGELESRPVVDQAAQAADLQTLIGLKINGRLAYPGLDTVVAAFGRDKSPSEVMKLINRRHDYLQDLTPLEWLARGGDLPALQRFAEAVSEPM